MSADIPTVLIVDGYNVLNAWKGLLSQKSLSEAREDLIHALSDYSGYTGEQVMIVFDAWKSERTDRSIEQVPSTVSVIYTRKGETADHYIERMCDELSERASYGRIVLRVATSDSLEQTITMGRGAIRISARELLRMIEEVRHPQEVKVRPVTARTGGGTIMDHLPEETRRQLEKMRLGNDQDG